VEESDAEGSEPLTRENFYDLIGMQAPVDGCPPKKLATVHGLYGIIAKRERLINEKFKVYEALIYFLLTLQLLLSAVFIILGSLRNVDSHVAIAILGAISTVIAGTLALLKGQGLPNRLRMTRTGLRRVMFEAKALYWNVGAGRNVTFQDIVQIRQDYLNVLKEAAMNHPDFWDDTATTMAQGISTTVGSKSGAVKAGKMSTRVPGATIHALAAPTKPQH